MEGKQEATTGQLGNWRWAEDWAVDLSCADVVRSLSSRFVGLRAVCTSWDSGELNPVAAGMTGWEVKGGHALSPPIDPALAQSWPESSCGFDEWYFFDAVPQYEALYPIGSWGVTLGEASDLRDLPSGFDLQEQLDRYIPRAVLGDGRRLFVITRDETLIAEFEQECRRRRPEP